MKVTGTFKLASSKMSYNKNERAHCTREHASVQSKTYVDKNGYHHTYKSEVDRPVKSDINKNISHNLRGYVKHSDLVKEHHDIYNYEKKLWKPYLDKRNKKNKRSRRLSYDDFIHYGKSKKKFKRDYSRYEHKMHLYRDKVKNWKSNGKRGNKPKHPKSPYGKRPIRLACWSFGNADVRQRIHDLVSKSYPKLGADRLTHRLMLAYNDGLINAVKHFNRRYKTHLKIFAYATNPDEVNKRAGAPHVHLGLGVRSTTAKGKPSNSVNNAIEDVTGLKNRKRALSKFKKETDGMIVHQVGRSLHYHFQNVPEFDRFALHRTGLGNGRNQVMTDYKRERQQTRDMKHLRSYYASGVANQQTRFSSLQAQNSSAQASFSSTSSSLNMARTDLDSEEDAVGPQLSYVSSASASNSVASSSNSSVASSLQMSSNALDDIAGNITSQETSISAEQAKVASTKASLASKSSLVDSRASSASVSASVASSKNAKDSVQADNRLNKAKALSNRYYTKLGHDINKLYPGMEWASNGKSTHWTKQDYINVAKGKQAIGNRKGIDVITGYIRDKKQDLDNAMSRDERKIKTEMVDIKNGFRKWVKDELHSVNKSMNVWMKKHPITTKQKVSRQQSKKAYDAFGDGGVTGAINKFFDKDKDKGHHRSRYHRQGPTF